MAKPRTNQTANSSRILSVTRKIEAPVDNHRYQETLEEKLYFVDTIGHFAGSIRESQGLNEISYKSGSVVLVDFTSKKSLEAYFQKIKSAKEAGVLQRLKSLGEHWETFHDFLESRDSETKHRIQHNLELAAWASCKGFFFEWALILCLLHEFRKHLQITTKILSIGRSQQPTLLKIQDNERYLWYQKNILANMSGLQARPDIMLTTNQFTPNSANITGIIECKHIRSLSTRTLREEYGKSRDIGPDYIILCSYNRILPKTKDGARNLGLTIFENPLSTPKRSLALKHKLLLLEEITLTVLAVEQEKPLRKRELAVRETLDEKRRVADSGSESE